MQKSIVLLVIAAVSCSVACAKKVDSSAISRETARELIEQNCLKCNGADPEKYLAAVEALELHNFSSEDADDLALLAREYSVVALSHYENDPAQKKAYLDKQRESYQRLTELRPGDIPARMNYISTLEKDDRVRALQSVMESGEGYVSAASALASIRLNDGKQDEAIALLEGAFQRAQGRDRFAIGEKLKSAYSRAERPHDALTIEQELRQISLSEDK